MPAPTASPAVSSTVGLKNMVIAPLTEDTEEGTTYGTLQAVAGAIEATITPESADPDVQYADDHEFDTLYPDPEVTFSTSMAEHPARHPGDDLRQRHRRQRRARAHLHRQTALLRRGLHVRKRRTTNSATSGCTRVRLVDIQTSFYLTKTGRLMSV